MTWETWKSRPRDEGEAIATRLEAISIRLEGGCVGSNGSGNVLRLRGDNTGFGGGVWQEFVEVGRRILVDLTFSW